MFKITKKESTYKDDGNKDFPKITESGVYVAQLVKVSLKKSQDHPDWTPGIRMVFKVVQEPFAGAFASGIVTSNWNPGNKLDDWLIALGVEGSELGDTLVVEQLRGQLARVNIEVLKDGFAKVLNVYHMRDVDHEKVVESALYQGKSSKTSQSTTESAEVQNVKQEDPAPAPANVSNQSASNPEPKNEGTVTQDDSIPF